MYSRDSTAPTHPSSLSDSSSKLQISETCSPRQPNDDISSVKTPIKNGKLGKRIVVQAGTQHHAPHFMPLKCQPTRIRFNCRPVSKLRHYRLCKLTSALLLSMQVFSRQLDSVSRGSGSRSKARLPIPGLDLAIFSVYLIRHILFICSLDNTWNTS